MSKKKSTIKIDDIKPKVFTPPEGERFDTIAGYKFIFDQNRASEKREEVYKKGKKMVNTLKSKYYEQVMKKELKATDYLKISHRLGQILGTLLTMDPMFNKLDEFDITEQQVQDVADGKLDPITMYNHISYTLNVDDGKGIGIRIHNRKDKEEHKEAYMKELKRLGRSPDNPTYQPPLKDTKKENIINEIKQLINDINETITKN